MKYRTSPKIGNVIAVIIAKISYSATQCKTATKTISVDGGNAGIMIPKRGHLSVQVQSHNDLP